MKNLQKFEVSKEVQKLIKGGSMEMAPNEICCEMSSNGLYCIRPIPNNKRCW